MTTPDSHDNGNEILTGFTLLSDTTKEALVDEIVAYQRTNLMQMELPLLRANVIEVRSTQYRRRLSEEAGLVEHTFGYTEKEDTNE